MGLVKPLLGFIFGVFIAGLTWRFFDDILVYYFLPYAVRGKYWDFTDLIWHILPIAILIIGIVCLIVSGTGGGSEKVVMHE